MDEQLTHIDKVDLLTMENLAMKQSIAQGELLAIQKAITQHQEHMVKRYFLTEADKINLQTGAIQRAELPAQ